MRADSLSLAECGRWDPSLETGDRTIDMGHLQLFAFVNDITAAVLANSPRREIKDAVTDLLRMIETHLTAEENLMRARDYPGLQEQREAHEHISRDLSGAIATYLTDWDSSVEPVLDCARTWLDEHVVTMDRALAEYLRHTRGDTPL